MPLIQENVALAPLTSWLVGGAAEYFSAPEDLSQLTESVAWGLNRKLRISILGGGTNVLISDRGVRGLVICLGKFGGIEVRESEGRLQIEAFAGVAKSELLKIFLKFKLAPALFLAGLPGDVGGGVVMNAGVGEMMTPREFVEFVDWVEVLPLDGRARASHELADSIQLFQREQLRWNYRHCSGWQPGIIVRVGMSWPLQPMDDILAQVKQANQIRLSKQPLHLPSCGSVFVNPPGNKAGALIDQSGLRGFRVGDAQVSEKHANFIVNLGHARAADIRAVIEHVKSAVLKKTGIQLHTEVVFMGEWECSAQDSRCRWQT